MLIVDYGREGIQWILDSLAEIGTFTVGSTITSRRLVVPMKEAKRFTCVKALELPILYFGSLAKPCV
jgi:hypothetical protein